MADIERAYLRLEKLRTKRATRLVACVGFGVVFVLFAVGTAWSLSSSDYPWVEGELAADIVTIAVSLALAVFTGFRARTFGRRADALSATIPVRRMSWLPPVSDGDSGGAELETQIRRLRTISRHSAALLAAWVGALLIGASGFVLLELIGQRLLDAGKHVAGTVERVHDARRGSSTMTVTYVADGTRRTVRIYRDWNSDLRYAPGQAVTVVYHPADPERVRTSAERNDNQLVLWSNFGLITVAGCVGIPYSATSMTGWRRRYRAVRATGWRRGTAEIVKERTRLAKMIVEYRDGSTIHLRTVSYPLRGVPWEGQCSEVPVWVGGSAGHMVIVLPGGRWSNGLYVVPVKAEAPRQDDDGWAP